MVPYIEGAGVEGIGYGLFGLLYALVELVERYQFFYLLLHEEPAYQRHINQLCKVIEPTCAIFREGDVLILDVQLGWLQVFGEIGYVFAEKGD
jgi:hypothetical protein